MKTPAKQIARLFDAYVRMTAIAGVGASTTVTTALTTALGTAADGGGSMPVQVSTTTAVGVVTTAGKNKMLLYANGTQIPMVDGSGNEVYARLTEAAGVYTATYFVLIAGVETAYTLPSTSIDLEFIYKYDFDRLPSDFAVNVSARHVTDDPAGSNTGFVDELRIPTATNTIAALSFTPNPLSSLELVVNGQTLMAVDGSFSNAGTAVTWIPAVAGYNLETTDKVIARYRK
jgi:hypothetical protein